MTVKSESEVTQLCPALSDPMDCSPPGSSAHGIFQARVLEWDAIAACGKFPDRGSNSFLLHWQQSPYHLATREAPWQTVLLERSG